MSLSKAEPDSTKQMIGDDARAEANPVSPGKTIAVSPLMTEENVDGGTAAWTQVVGCFFLFFNAWGVINTYGVYQTYYQIDILTTYSPSDIAWIGSIQSFLLLFVGTLSGPIYDAGYFRPLIWVGSFLIVFGHMMLSLCNNFWEILLAQAFCIGIGTGCLYVPGLAVLSTYFRAKLALANGLAASGASLGGVIYPIILHRLYGQIGFGWTVRVLGFFSFALLVVPCLLMKPRTTPARVRSLIDPSAFRDIPFGLFTFGGFLAFMGLYVFFFYVQLFAIEEAGVNTDLALYLIAILNGASTFGRILPNMIADHMGPVNVLVLCSTLAGVLQLCLLPAIQTGSVIALTALFGFCSGTFVSLPGTIVVQMTQNKALIGTRIGMSFAVCAVGVLIGTPIAGAILKSSGSFSNVWVFGGVMTLAGTIFFIGLRGARAGWGLRGKA